MAEHILTVCRYGVLRLRGGRRLVRHGVLVAPRLLGGVLLRLLRGLLCSLRRSFTAWLEFAKALVAFAQHCCQSLNAAVAFLQPCTAVCKDPVTLGHVLAQHPQLVQRGIALVGLGVELLQLLLELFQTGGCVRALVFQLCLRLGQLLPVVLQRLLNSSILLQTGKRPVDLLLPLIQPLLPFLKRFYVFLQRLQRVFYPFLPHVHRKDLLPSISPVPSGGSAGSGYGW